MTNVSPTDARASIYPASLEHLDGEVLVRFPDFPEVLTGAVTEKEALAEAADALEEAVLGRLARSEEIPLPPTELPAGHVRMMLAPLTATRVMGDRAAWRG